VAWVFVDNTCQELARRLLEKNKVYPLRKSGHEVKFQEMITLSGAENCALRM
jgi:hypothetical protein